MTPLYWQVYKNLEREFLALSEIIHINDSQQEVYSMKIADLLIRTVVEIESLAKELYLSNGGAIMPDVDMYFDTVCMAHLESLWILSKKVVLVTAPTIYFEQDCNKILTPLHKASKRGTSSADWNKAYQAVKHNRVKELHKGNLKNLLHGLAALYLLNLYYRDEHKDKVKETDRNNVDTSFGSSLFAVKIHIPGGFKSDGVYQKNDDFDECAYIFDYESVTFKRGIDALAAMEKYINDSTEKLLEERFENVNRKDYL